MKLNAIICTLLFVLGTSSAYAQTPSFFKQDATWKSDIVYNKVTPVSTDVIRSIHSDPLNHSIAVKQDYTDVSVYEHAIQEEDSSYQYLYYAIQAKDAQALALRLKDVNLPAGSVLFFLHPNSNEYLGPYTAEQLGAGGSLYSGFIMGSRLVMEVQIPKKLVDEFNMEIDGVDYGFDSQLIQDGRMMLSFGDALDCQVNVNCPSNTNWQDIRKSVCRITVVTDQAAYWCSGTLMNNTSADQTPYVLTAKHCYFNDSPQYDLWTFDFGFEADGCANPDSAPNFNTIFGSTLRAERTESDFILVELDAAVPDAYDVVYAGWDKTTALADTSVLIAHPVGDIKKISFDYDEAIVYPSDLDFGLFIAPADHLFELTFDLGIFEVGSSGGPMLNEHAQVVGQLTGGFANDCNSIITYYGRFNRSWADGSSASDRLSDWLDPLGLNPDTLGMLDPSSGGHLISGAINYQGSPVSNVEVELSGGAAELLTTSSDGLFQFTGLAAGLDYNIICEKNNDLTNGVSTLDAVFIQKHILGLLPLTDPYQLIAADINNNGAVSTLDIVFMQKAILGLETSFPNNSSWRFIPADYVFDDPLNPFSPVFPEELEFIDLQGDALEQDFVAIKVGDVNGNANPDL